MARTRRKEVGQTVVGRQAPTGAWTPDQLASVFRDRSDEERRTALELAGIIDEKGNITPLYKKDWGKRVTRTPDVDA